MNIKDLILSADNWKRLRDTESVLLKRRGAGTVAGWIAVLTASLQVVFVLADKGYLDHLLKFNLKTLYKEIGTQQLIAWMILFVAAILFFIFRRTSLLFKETNEPFRYTFFIEPFAFIESTADGITFPPDGKNKLKTLLHHDLTERLNDRIQRFSILENSKTNDDNSTGEKKITAQVRQTSHIHISGHFAVRENKKNEWILHIIPSIRIGPTGTPATLASPVKYPLTDLFQTFYAAENERNQTVEDDTILLSFTADEYNQIVERVYSRIATEVYKRIESDVRKKITLFPTAYLRALALFHEAEDFASSNTIDAYERSITLYRDAIESFEKARLLSSLKWKYKFLPLPGKSYTRYVHQRTRLAIGYAKCQVYRKYMSALSGRQTLSIYDLPWRLQEIEQELRRLHARACAVKTPSRLHFLSTAMGITKNASEKRRLQQPLFNTQQKLLFDLYVVLAFTHLFFYSYTKTEEYIKWAEATAPHELSDALYLLVKGTTEDEPNKAILRFQQAVELSPDFQIARWNLARASEKEFKWQDEISPERVWSVIQEYNEILKINAGNIAALGSKGYLLWLVHDSEQAEVELKEGKEIKTIVRDTFIGELNYRLARIAAERGDYNACRNLYMESLAADPSIGACSLDMKSSRALRSDFSDITSNVLRRFKKYKETVEDAIIKINASGKVQSLDSDYWLLFSEEIRYRDNLDKLEFPQLWRKKFQERSIYLSAKVKVKVQEPAALWYIEDEKQHRYLVKENAGRLDVMFECSEKTLKVVYGFVLNDYGNACLCYFHNNGAQEILAEAIEAYEKAIVHNPDDATPYYNLANAYGWAAKGEKIAHVLGKARFLAPTWSSLAIDVEKESINKYDIPKEALEKRLKLKKKELDAIKNTPTKAENLSTIGKNDGQGNHKKSEEAEAKLKIERSRIEREIAKIESEIIKLKDEFPEKLNQSLNQIWAISRISGLYEGSLSEITKRIIKTPWKCLDENDVDILIAMAEIMSRSTEKEHLQAAKQIIMRVKDLHPEDYPVVNVLITVLEKLLQVLREEMGKDAGLLRDEDSLREYDQLNSLLQNTYKDRQVIVDSWVTKEPRSFLSLLWFLSIEDESTVERLNKIRREKFHSTTHRFDNLLGNVYFALNRLKEAIVSYDKASKEKPEESLYLFNKGNAYLFTNDGFNAVEALEKAVAANPSNEMYNKKLALGYNLVGNEYFSKADYKTAANYYIKCIAADPKQPVYHSNLSLAFENSKGPSAAENISLAIQHLERALQYDNDNEEYFKRLQDLRRLKAAYACYGSTQTTESYLGVTPLVIEYSDHLSGFIVDAKKEVLLPSVVNAIGVLQDNIVEQYGVNIPGVRWRSNNDVPGNDWYVISINEVPLVVGKVYPSHKYCLEKSEKLDLQGIKGEKTKDPLTGEEYAWLSKEACDLANKADLTLLDPMQFMVRHLDAVLRKNLVEFAGHQEVYQLCKDSDLSDVRAIPDSPPKLSLLTDLVQLLLAEEISIRQFDDVATVFNENYETASVDKIADRYRELPSIKKNLHDKRSQQPLFALDSEFEGIISGSIQHSNGMDLLAMTPEVCQEALSAIRQHINSTDKATLVVNKPSIRIHTKRLVELEFPELQVISRNEAENVSPEKEMVISYN